MEANTHELNNDKVNGNIEGNNLDQTAVNQGADGIADQSNTEKVAEDQNVGANTANVAGETAPVNAGNGPEGANNENDSQINQPGETADTASHLDGEEVLKYKVTGIVEIRDGQGQVQGIYQSGATYAFPKSVGDSLVADGRAELHVDPVQEEEVAEDQQ